ncbi:LOW QUALITY PROTEIN: uncharacterized protein [Argopecten irradians]|uniref:LOW QUALITY PROTEIN: uncharacterized protein n=1 Tax=Argopecten irradians TaxID=31199 RepID=UPI0037207CA7
MVIDGRMAPNYGLLLVLLSFFVSTCFGQSLILPKGRYDDTLRGLCRDNDAYAKVPWDCQAYVQCKSSPGSREIFLQRCPASLEFNMKHKTCGWPESSCPPLKDLVDSFCLNHPTARLPNPDSCAQYYDCSNPNTGQFTGATPYLRECTHPQLFDLVTFDCLDYRNVQCGNRKQPVSPCDYKAYQCTGPDCKKCTDQIPGCVGKKDGPNPHPSRLLSNYFVVCQNGKATSVETCSRGLFDPTQGRCTTQLDPLSVEAFCRENPRGKIPNPSNCAMVYDCTRTSQRNNFLKYEDECPYPMYYSEIQSMCMDFRDVQCGFRSQPINKCDYQRYSCSGANCPVCEQVYPSCAGLSDGLHPYPGKEGTPAYIECFQSRTVDSVSTCPNGAVFDPRTKSCSGGTGPVNPTITNPGTGGGSVNPYPNPGTGGGVPPSGGDCVSNPRALLPDMTNCARYIDCSKVDPTRGLASMMDECPYPQLFSTRTSKCGNFIDVSCGSRYEPKSPCEYENTRNLCNGPMCQLECEERSPSCVGRPDGNNTFPDRQLTSFYISCMLERTLSVGICRYGVYDPPTLRRCTTQLDPASVHDFCRKNPTTVFPHVADCARYYNCSDNLEDPVFGPYLRECRYPELFNIVRLQCVPPKEANCRWRLEPKNPCDYMYNQYCPEPDCEPCEIRFPGCVGRTDGRHPVSNTEDKYFVCSGGMFVSIDKCRGALGSYDPVARQCVAPYNCGGYENGNHPIAGTDTDYFTCMDRQYVSKGSCAPDTFDPMDRVCVQSPCAALLDGNYIIPGQKTEFFICQNGKYVDKMSCAPFTFDEKTRECLTHPDCTGLDGNFPMLEAPSDFFTCRNGRYIESASCAPETFNLDTGMCNLPSCTGRPNGNNAVAGSLSEFVVCRNSYYLRTGSCTPSTFDQESRQCKALDCSQLADGTYPISGTDVSYTGSDSDWIRCEGGLRVSSGTCDPLPYNPITSSCQASPSCVGKPNGNNAMLDNNVVYYNCENGILLYIQSCAPFPFDPVTGQCGFPSCAGDGNFAIPYNNRLYITCRNGEIAFEGDCGTSLFDPATGLCRALPECFGLLQGNNALPGTEDIYFECAGGNFMKMYSCTPQIYNPLTGRCIPPINPTDPATFCQRDPTAIFPHPDSCARYISCANENTQLGNYQEECAYPTLLDSNDGICKPYREVKCGGRMEPKSPCDYEKTRQCTLPNGSCPPCEQEHPSCVGKRDGPHAIANRPEWFVQCADERTYAVEKCPETAPYFDPIIGSCSVILDPLNPGPYCKANPTVVASHPDNCAQYIDCRQLHTDFGNYKQECPYSELFDDQMNACRPYINVNCGTRPVPKAPCEYEANMRCLSNRCTICEETFPSCVGLPDGNNPFPGQLTKYIVCRDDRTLSQEACANGYYDDAARICTLKFDPADPEPYCAIKPNDLVANEMLCSQYYDCSKPGSAYGRNLHECQYPLLFSRTTKSCQDFSTVDCDTRFEPIQPCEYLQNKCVPTPGSAACVPCAERLPPCIGRPDGNNTFPGRENTPYFITCFKNRTIFVRTCEQGYFDPISKMCQFEIDTTNPRPFCAYNPTVKVPHPGSCAKYFDCSAEVSIYGDYVQECQYPLLYSTATQSCDEFDKVDCGDAPIPQAPCEYDQNTCAITQEPGCRPCEERLPSCIGKEAGNHTFPGRELSTYYIVCFRNRTVAVRSCSDGFFDPATGYCTTALTAAAIRGFCVANPGVIKANPLNCAQYFDCGNASIRAQTFLRECPYPMQFETNSLACQNFTDVICDTRKDIKLPCDYLQNRCNPADPNCQPCEERIPSCAGLPDGNNPYPGRPMTKFFIVCLQERTVSIEKCERLFDPGTSACVNDVTEAMVKLYCLNNKDAIQPHPYQCAQYYDCRRAIGGSYLRECKYPQLFDGPTDTCRNFSEVDCKDKFIPQAPCDYLQNHCPPNYPGCQPCEERLPSCVSLPDGNNPFPGRPSSEFYIQCFQNRTVSVEACQVSQYDHSIRSCSPQINPNLLSSHCTDRPFDLIPDPTNCARYFNCSNPGVSRGMVQPYLAECKYPKLFVSSSMGCQIFTTVSCQDRYEPRAPCEYIQNQCFGAGCEPCEDRFPSCIGKDDGSNVFPGKELTRLYTVCYSNRTVAIVRCAVGVYNHTEKACVQESVTSPTTIR